MNMIALSERNHVTSEELEEYLKQRESGEVDFLLIDVREQMEYDHQYVKGVDSLKPTSTFQSWGQEFFDANRERTVIFTCRTGSRSANVQRVFRQHGMNNVINHYGGIVSYDGETARG
jgi:rhodanese-related sulfurtransferase